MNNNAGNQQAMTTNKEHSVIAWLEAKRDLGEFNSMDIHLARFIEESLDSKTNHEGSLSANSELHSSELESSDLERNLIIYLAALVSRNALRQHTCLSLSKLSERIDTVLTVNDQPHELSFELPPKSQWHSILTGSDLLSDLVKSQSGELVESSENNHPSPFVLYNDLFYLHRYFQYEKHLANFIVNKTATAASAFRSQLWFNTLTDAQIQQVVIPLFDQSAVAHGTGSENEHTIDWQQQAVLNSVNSGFSIISGGPGTGKTTTVIKLLVALQRLKRLVSPDSDTLNIQLVAPTGKAAQRLSESIAGSAAKMNISDDEKRQLPTEALTIHRLLKPKGMNEFFHNARNPLGADVIIVDEASMVDISLMNKLVAAIPKHAQLILLGDQQQLASVEAGNVMGDLCSASQFLATTNPALTFQTELQKSYRFDDGSDIGQLAKAVKAGDVRTALQAMSQGQLSNEDLIKGEANNQALLWYKPELNQLPILIEAAVNHYVKLYQHAANANDLQFDNMFNTLAEFQLLACVKQSEWGVDFLNQQIQLRLARRLKMSTTAIHYVGRPIMISENAYHMGLYNGDIGIEVFDPSTNQLVAVFADNSDSAKQNGGNGYKFVACQRLPAHQTCYAMTVHKSQGSEFEHAVLVLPEQKSLIHNISRELLYTGLTRAKKRFSLYSTDQALSSAIQKRTERFSGLANMISQTI